jgi:hypothetical protein
MSERVRIVDGAIEYPVYVFRFLFGNGDVLDVRSMQDDSRLREAILKERAIDGDRIVGTSDGTFVGYMRVEPKE